MPSVFNNLRLEGAGRQGSLQIAGDGAAYTCRSGRSDGKVTAVKGVKRATWTVFGKYANMSMTIEKLASEWNLDTVVRKLPQHARWIHIPRAMGADHLHRDFPNATDEGDKVSQLRLQVEVSDDGDSLEFAAWVCVGA